MRSTAPAAVAPRRATLATALGLLFLAPAFSQSPGMELIPAGAFEMGRSHALPDDGLRWFPVLLRDDRPVRVIELDAYQIDRHEVTNREFWAFVQEGGVKAPYYWPNGEPPAGKQEQPVANITWAEADAYCKWRGMRLPTEAEWEKACRGGLDKQKYAWGGETCSKEKAHYDSVDGPVKVCSYEPNGYQLCDMAGNVWEWTADWYARTYYESAPAKNPPGPADGEYKVLRGGSWADAEKFLTCAHRSYARPIERSPNIGFRCAAPAEAK